MHFDLFSKLKDMANDGQTTSFGVVTSEQCWNKLTHIRQKIVLPQVPQPRFVKYLTVFLSYICSYCSTLINLTIDHDIERRCVHNYKNKN